MIAPSILSADFSRLADEVARIDGSDWVHVDVMDNHFVPNLTLGLPVVESLLKQTSLPMDCHLMIDEPHRWAPQYAAAGAYNVTFHVEAATNPIETAKAIRSEGAKAGAALKPATPLSSYEYLLPHLDTLLVMTVEPGFGGQAFIEHMLTKIADARHAVDSGHLELIIEVDGGISESTIERVAAAGADCFVAGSAVFGSDDPAAMIEHLRGLATSG